MDNAHSSTAADIVKMFVCVSAGFTDQPGELRGFPVHAHLTKGSRGFGFNIVGGSKPDEFLQVYSVTSDGPSNLKTGMSQGKRRVCVPYGPTQYQLTDWIRGIIVLD